MLVLSRKAGERIVIGGSIVLTIVRIDGKAVRVGIEAPPEVAVLREELLTGPAEPGDGRGLAAAR